MEIKLDAEAAASIASAAIFESLSVEARENVLKQAVAHLMEPNKSTSYPYNAKTPLQNAFESAISMAARRAVEDRIQTDPELQQAIHDLMGPLINGALKAEAENYDSSLADTIGAAVGTWLAEKARESR